MGQPVLVYIGIQTRPGRSALANAIRSSTLCLLYRGPGQACDGAPTGRGAKLLDLADPGALGQRLEAGHAGGDGLRVGRQQQQQEGRNKHTSLRRQQLA